MTTLEPAACGRMDDLPGEALAQVAAHFRALAEPTRLRILDLLRQRERSVGELARLRGCSAANVSRHLALLQRHGLVARESRGSSAIYRIAEPSVHTLCDLVCGNVARELERAVRAREAFAPAGRQRGNPVFSS
jgi:DNA-binding transcriptional ArsR family regulator